LIAKCRFCSRKKVDLRANFRCGAVLNKLIVNKPIVDLGALETSSFWWSSYDRIGRLEIVLEVWSSPKQAHSKPGVVLIPTIFLVNL
jgi:hypothetical protein